MKIVEDPKDIFEISISLNDQKEEALDKSTLKISDDENNYEELISGSNPFYFDRRKLIKLAIDMLDAR